MVQARQTAYKVWISDLIKGRYVKEEGEWTPNYILVKDKKVSRVNIIATIINVSVNEGYGVMELDDGYGGISARVWGDDIKMLEGLDVGEMVNVVGRPRQFGDKIFLAPEVIKKIDVKWARLRKLELEKEYGIPEAVQGSESVGDDVVEDSSKGASEGVRQKVLRLIGKNDEINYDELVKELEMGKEEVDLIINELIKEGEVYQPRPGFLKVI